MVDSTGSGDIVDEFAAGAAEFVVENDARCEAEGALEDAFFDAVERAGAVAFEGEQVFAGLEDRLDPLPDRGDGWPLAGFGLAPRPDDRGVELAGPMFEVAAGVAEIADHEQVALALAALTQRQADVAFGCLGRAEQQRARGVLSSANQPCNRKPQKERLWLTQ